MNGIFSASGRFLLCAFGLCALTCSAAWAAPESAPDKGKKDEVVWGEMPAGARTTYIGIHGGTVPVSLLTAGDGSPMIALVGLTGSDFLNFLRSKGKLTEEPPLAPPLPASPAPSETPPSAAPPSRSSSATSEAVSPAAPAAEAKAEDLPASPPPVHPESNATLLLAGSSSGDIPVIYATGRTFERMSLVPANWAPFGLTEKALSVEGEIKVLAPPKKFPRKQQKKKRRG